MGKKFEEALDLSPGADPRVLANDWGTQPATLNVADIPKEVNELFVAIELIGRGRVWIDDVEVLQSWLHPDERIYLQGSMFVAKQKLAENNPFPAEQLLGSHWGNYLSQFQPMESNSTASRSQRLDAAKEVEDNAKDQGWNEKPNLFQQLRDSMRERWRR